MKQKTNHFENEYQRSSPKNKLFSNLITHKRFNNLPCKKNQESLIRFPVRRIPQYLKDYVHKKSGRIIVF